MRAEDFFYNLDILYGGLGIGKLQFLIKKEKKNFSCNFFFNFWCRIFYSESWRLPFSLQPGRA
jgi:hypothetical protein